MALLIAECASDTAELATLQRRDTNPRTVQAWLGHRDLSTTEIYIHYIGTSADETAIALVNSAVSSTSPSAGGAAKNGEPHRVA